MNMHVSIPESLRPFLEAEMRAGGYGTIDEYVTALLERTGGDQGKPRTVRAHGTTYYLCRMSDCAFGKWHKRSIAIEEYRGSLSRLTRHDSDQLNLAETYAVLKLLFGERGRCFDNWKGSFAFPLALHVELHTAIPSYLLEVINFRAGVEYQLRRVVAPHDPRLSEPKYYPPDPAFPREAFDCFLAHMDGLQKGYWESCRNQWKDHFLLKVPSNLILYGFDGQEFFERGFADGDDFDRALAELSRRLPEPGCYRR